MMLRAHVLDFWLLLRKIAPNATAILLVLLGAALFFQAVEAWREASLLNCFACAFYLMIGEAIELPDVWYLEVLVFLLPLAGVLLAAEGVISATVLFLNKSRRQGEWNMVVASTYKGHTVICGMRQLGSVLCEGLHSAGRKVVAVDVDEDLAAVVTARRRGIPVIIGDMSQPDTLAEANIRQASCVILCSGDDLANLEAAIAAKELNPDAEVHVRVYGKSLADRISAALQQDIHTFSPYASAAEMLLSQMNSEEDRAADAWDRRYAGRREQVVVVARRPILEPVLDGL